MATLAILKAFLGMVTREQALYFLRSESEENMPLACLLFQDSLQLPQMESLLAGYVDQW